jgi:uncharacterized membrane protein
MTQLIQEYPVTRSASGTIVPAPARPRLDGIDLLRGIVIVLMALDHVKGNIAYLPFDPVDLSSQTTWAYFVTRWVTHFCAPVFVFLAGTGAFLYGARGRTKRELSWFLLSRGLWLIVLELTVIRFSWVLNLDYYFDRPPTFGQVIWAIGWGMIVLSGLVYLPVSISTTFGLALIIFHNLADRVQPEDWGNYSWAWIILHTGGTFEVLPGVKFWPFYPLIPWIGVLAAGYGFGPLMRLEPKQRRKEVLGLGIMLTLTFVALRWSNLYGDKFTSQPGQPGPWSVQKDWLFTIFSFVNCQKYPPSLDFLLMTLGPALIALALFDREAGPVGKFFITFGRVPLFFYLLHWFVIKGVAIALAYHHYSRADWMYGSPPPNSAPPDYGYDLWVVYLVWLGVVLVLFPLCYWFAGVKRRSRAAWLSYF